MVRKRKQLYVSYKFYTFILHPTQTRMHSSRMRTVRCRGRRGMSTRGCVYPSMHWAGGSTPVHAGIHPSPPTEFLTLLWKHYLSATTLRTVIIIETSNIFCKLHFTGLREKLERYYNLYLRIISDVNGYIPLNGVCNWYDSAGQINQQKIRAIMEKENCNVCIAVSLRYNP